MARRPKDFSEPKAAYATPRRRVQTNEAARDKRRLPAPEALPDGTIRYFLVLGPKGRVLLPADVREVMGLKEGDVITAWLSGGELRMHSHRRGLEAVEAEGAAIADGGVYASDELIAERRAEAAKEAEEELLRQRRRPHGRKGR